MRIHNFTAYMKAMKVIRMINSQEEGEKSVFVFLKAPCATQNKSTVFLEVKEERSKEGLWGR